jgi:hypothetical protein
MPASKSLFHRRTRPRVTKASNLCPPTRGGRRERLIRSIREGSCQKKITAKTRSKDGVGVGQRVPPGEQMFMISQTQGIWITADFKEMQLRKMRQGRKADIHVDAYGRTFHGYVENMPGATGSVASLLPPENAAANFVKVVQRLPVRNRLMEGEDPDHRLRLGMPVEPQVWLR